MDNRPHRTLNEILEVIEAIPERMCGGRQPRFLYELSRQTHGRGAVIEIGTCAGKSAIALAYGRFTKNGVVVNSIDIARHPQLERHLQDAGVEAYVNSIIGESSAVASGWSEPVELLWIDGDHSYRQVSRDIQSWAALVIAGGVMAFHDYPAPGGRGLGGVGRAVYDLVLSKPD